MLYTLKEIAIPGSRKAWQIRDPNDALVVELYHYPTIERILTNLNAHVARRHTHALGHTAIAPSDLAACLKDR